MQKPIEEMSDHEMLVELLREKRRAGTLRYVKIAVYSAIIIAIGILCAIYLPPIIAYLTVQQIQQAMQQIQSATDSVRDTVAGIGESGADALREASEKLNELLEKVPRFFR